MRQIWFLFLRSPPSLKFAFVGGIGFLVDLSTLLFLHNVFEIKLMIARIIAFCVAASSNWLLNRVLTFAHRDLAGRKSAEWLRFLMSAGMSAIPNIGGFYLLMLFLPKQLPYIIFAMCIGILIGYYSNYRLASSWVYKSDLNR